MAEVIALFFKFNNDKVNVMLITKSGMLGIDFKGVKKVIVLESTWNKATENQIIGRAHRYNAHKGYPHPHKIDVYKFIVKKPSFGSMLRDSKDTTGSADEILERISIEKAKQTDTFIKQLKTISIENKNIIC